MDDAAQASMRARLLQDLATFELDAEDLDAALEFSHGVFRATADVITESEQPPALAAAAVGELLASHAIDREIEEESAAGQAPACARGCAACCHIPVSVTAADIARLLRWYGEQSADRQQEIGARLATALPRATGERPRGVLPCPLLDVSTGSCEAYEARPLACRGCFSEDARQCVPGGEISAFVAPLVIARSAALGVRMALEEVGADGRSRDLIVALAEVLPGFAATTG